MLMRRLGRDPNQPAPGVRRHGAGWQTRVTVRSETRLEQWPLDTPLAEMTTWLEDTRAELRVFLPKIQAGTFPKDAQRYLDLPSVKALPTYDERCRHIADWARVFRDRRRRSIKPPDIERERDALLAAGYAGASVNKRLRALSNLWTKLDGRRAPNPVLEVDECDEREPDARGLPYAVIDAILAAIPDTAIGVKKDGTRTTGKNVPRPSKTKARLRVIAHTGLAHAQLKALTKADVDLEHGTMRVLARKKGKRHRRAQDRPTSTVLPLTPQAVDAFREFDRIGCWGAFSNSSMWKAFDRACARLQITGLRPYDLRHSFASAVYDATRDLRVTGVLLSHRVARTTTRYTLATVAPHVQAAIDALATKLATGDAEVNGMSRNSAESKSGGQSPDGPSESS